MRLQIEYDKQRVDTGILLVDSKRNDKSPFGNTSELIRGEIDMLYPTIHLPVSVCIFNTGVPILYDEEGNAHSTSFSQDDNPAT